MTQTSLRIYSYFTSLLVIFQEVPSPDLAIFQHLDIPLFLREGAQALELSQGELPAELP